MEKQQIKIVLEKLDWTEFHGPIISVCRYLLNLKEKYEVGFSDISIEVRESFDEEYAQVVGYRIESDFEFEKREIVTQARLEREAKLEIEMREKYEELKVKFEK